MTTAVLTGDELAALATLVGSAPFPGVVAPTFDAVPVAHHQHLVAGFGLTLLERGLLEAADGGGLVPTAPIRAAVDALTGLETWLCVERVTAGGATITSLYASAAAVVSDRVVGPFHQLTPVAEEELPAQLRRLAGVDDMETPATVAPTTVVQAPRSCSRAAVRDAVTRVGGPGAGDRPQGPLEGWLAEVGDAWRTSTTARLVDLADSGAVELAWFTILDAGAAGCWRIEPDGDQELDSIDAFDDAHTPCGIEPVASAELGPWLDGWWRRATGSS